MILDPYGKSFFRLICKQFAYLHFDVRDTGAKESVPIFISESMKKYCPQCRYYKAICSDSI